MDTVVGIDLGTTNSLVGAVVDGDVQLFTDEGSPLVPSIVGRGASDEILVGRRARNRRLLDPEGTVRSIKRQMGRDVTVRVGRESFRPPEVSAFILAALLDVAERALGVRPTRGIVTVPAYFDEHQRQATLDAGELAKLEILRLVNEPTAAALAESSGTEESVLVYDLGGGTFDVSVLERDEGFLEVRASHGDTALGGDDVDHALLAWVLDRLGPQAEVVRSERRAMMRLSEAVERAKIALSTSAEARIVEPYLAGDGAGIVNLDVTVSREQLESVAAPFVERTLSSVDQALRQARLRPENLDRILLVGGASQMPLVSRRLSEHLDMPVQLAREPDRAVALGAARLAGRAAGHEVHGVLVDVTPFTLGAGVVFDDPDELRASPVIPRGTVVPVTREKTFFTLYEDQDAVEIPICQGDAPYFDHNTSIGELVVSDIPPSPEQSPIDVRFKLDLSGVLHATATHRPSGRTATVSIKRGPTQLTERQRAEATERVESLRAKVGGPSEAEPDAGDESERRLASALLSRAARALSDDVGTNPMRARVEAAVGKVRTALEAGVIDDDAIEALTDALYDLDDADG